MRWRPPTSTLFPYTTLFRSDPQASNSSRTGAVLKCGIKIDARGLQGRGESEEQAREQRHASSEQQHAMIEWRVDEEPRSEEHTSELQSLRHLVCRLLLEKKK